eukprot:Nitzschia sp. Nitz4//scaffold71_size96697//92910//93422//NITZ4_004713-RA/size96697-processed-gene-0.53-mRNA-1//-1//CDS//3329557301//8340//frame0
MKTSDAPLLEVILRFIDNRSLLSLPDLLFDVGRKLVFPALVALFLTGTCVSTLKATWKVIVPPSLPVRYRDARRLYSSGNVTRALKDWARLEQYGPAYLSRATHALYVDLDPSQALAILRQAKEKRVRIQLNQVKMIQLDAKAIQAGSNVTMIDFNARLAKQEHLGIATL